MRQKRERLFVRKHTSRTMILLLLVIICVSCVEAPKSSSPTPAATRLANATPTATSTPSPTRITETSNVAGLTVPSGFQISTYVTGLQAPRMLTIGPRGVLLVADRGSGSIIAFPAGSSLAHPAPAQTVVSGLNDPTSVVWDNSMLYVGEYGDIARIALGDDLKAGQI